MKDLTVSPVDRQNILNNDNALNDIKEYIGVKGMLFDGEYRFTKNQIKDFYLVDDSTIERYLSSNETELKHNGYEVLKGKRLKEFKNNFSWLLEDGSKAPQLGIFNFRAFLNIGMLLVESEKAKALRSSMLDIVIDSLNKKLGGSTKFINQKDEEFLVAISREPFYRKEFTNALNLYLEMGNYKYAAYTDAIYKAVFNENAIEYKTILRLEEKENPRDTMYADVLNLIASFEIGIADEMKAHFITFERKLEPNELDLLIDNFSKKRHWIPLLEDARIKMASRDYGFRNIIHERLDRYIKCIPVKDFNKFLGDSSKDLVQRILETPELLDVFKRLKDR